jgi:hypothetical protein
MPDGFDYEDNDLGLEDLLKESENANFTLEVGILESSEKGQFRLGKEQGFKEETANLLLDVVTDDDMEKVCEIGERSILEKTDPTAELKSVGDSIKERMREKTDNPGWGEGSKTPRPQLAQAIKVEVKK